MSVFLNNLDDFIAPSQACVNPFVLNRKPEAGTKLASSKITLQSDFSSTEFERPKESLIRKPDLIKSRVSTASKGQKVAAVSLNDCLACSGCVTSAETVLIQEQSYQKLLDRISDRSGDGDVVVVCLSPQSIASMATFIGISSSDMFLRVATALKNVGVYYVVDTSSAGDVALVEAREEFLMRYRNGKSALWSKPPHTVAASSSTVFLIPSSISSKQGNGDNSTLFGAKLTELVALSDQCHAMNSTMSVADENNNGNDLLDVGASINGDQALPMLASQCPGWVCYAEKTQPQSLPFISHTKSPQQIVGTILKQLIFKQQLLGSSAASAVFNSSYLNPSLTAVGAFNSSNSNEFDRNGIRIMDIDGSILDSPSQHDLSKVKSVYIVSVQPCFDKKLESSRKDFMHLDTGSQEVDLVLSTTELWSFLEDLAAAFSLSTAAAAATASEFQQKFKKEMEGKEEDEEEEDSIKMDVTLEPPPSLSVSEFLLMTSPDSPHGRDDVETLFRSCSVDGRAFVSAVDSNGSSGGYLEHIFRYAAERLGGRDLWGKPLVYTAGRNVDVCEVSLSSQIDSQTGLTEAPARADIKLKFGRAYGFRNIQSLMLKMKQGKCDLDFVEIMACPSGCVNGGGQLKESGVEGVQGEMIRELSSVTAARVCAVDATFHNTLHRRVEDCPLVKFLYSSTSSTSLSVLPSSPPTLSSSPCESLWKSELIPPPATATPHTDPPLRDGSGMGSGLLGLPLGPESMALLHTRYHSVPKLELIAPLAAKW